MMVQLESEMLGIEGDGAEHTADLVPNAMKALHLRLNLLSG